MLVGSAAVVLSFFAVLANLDGMWNESLVQHLVPQMGIISAEVLLVKITIAFVVAVLLAGAILLLNSWL